MFHIDNRSKIPLYMQLKTIVLEKIHSGEWQPGDMLPTETNFQDQFGVSRITVRHALDDLEHEGYIIKRQGIGTFVAQEKLSYHLPKLTSFTEDMQLKGYVPGSKLIDLFITQNSSVARYMNLEPETDLLYMRRLRTLNGEVLGVHDAYFNLALFKRDTILSSIEDGSLQNELDNSASFYSILENRYNVVIGYADESIEAVSCPQDVASQLESKPNVPILLLKRITYSVEDQVIEYVKMYNRADMYKYAIRLTR